VNDKAKLDEIRARLEEWEGKNQEKLTKLRKPANEFVTDSGILLKHVYTPVDLEEKGFDYLKDLGLPGEYPFTRSISPTLYREAIWGTRMYAGRETPEESNELFRTIAASGGGRVSMAFDLPTQLGYDPDNPLSRGEVGRVGASLSSLRDWEIAFDGIELKNMPLNIVLNAPAIVGLASHFALAKRQGIPLASLMGSCQNDTLKEYTARGNYIFPPQHAIRLVGDTLAFCARNTPAYLPLQVCSAHFGDSGATPVHEASFALINAIAYFDACVERGISVDEVAPGVSFLMHADYYGFFERIAKIRAMRKIYARIMKERYGAKNPESMMGRWKANEGGPPLTREQYLLNITRIGMSAMVMALSGCQEFGLRPYDEQFGTPSTEAIILSGRISNVVGYETGVADVVDPLAGSYFIESLTLEIEERINKEMDAMLKMGGAVKCIENGYIQSQLARDGYKWIKDRQSGKTPWVGVNIFRSEEQTRPAVVYRAKADVEKRRIEQVQELRKKRDTHRVMAALAELKALANLPPTKENNLMPAVIEAVEAYATVGEVTDTLKDVWGTFKDRVTF